MGAKLADPKKNAPKDTPPHPDANKVSLLVGLDGKSVELILPELEIESANLQFGSSTMQSGTVALKGLHIQARYDSDSLLQPLQAEAKIDSLVANDLLLAKNASMVTATRLVVNALRLPPARSIPSARARRGRAKGRCPCRWWCCRCCRCCCCWRCRSTSTRRITGLVSDLEEPGPEGPRQPLWRTTPHAAPRRSSFTLGSLDVEGPHHQRRPACGPRLGARLLGARRAEQGHAAARRSQVARPAHRSPGPCPGQRGHRHHTEGAPGPGRRRAANTPKPTSWSTCRIMKELRTGDPSRER